ncbi:hypothetical protein DFQ98_07340 [Salmonella enterica subsp. enterica serovar Essen]|nr:hypothetical protein [Salmonella enterica subsp. enterica serovar Essen]
MSFDYENSFIGTLAAKEIEKRRSKNFQDQLTNSRQSLIDFIDNFKLPEETK